MPRIAIYTKYIAYFTTVALSAKQKGEMSFLELTYLRHPMAVLLLSRESRCLYYNKGIYVHKYAISYQNIYVYSK